MRGIQKSEKSQPAIKAVFFSDLHRSIIWQRSCMMEEDADTRIDGNKKRRNEEGL